MAFSHGTPNSIVTDGLVFCMDPANKSSYPGSGTAITDIVGGYNGITVNSPTFSTDDGGAFTNTGAKYLQFDTGLYDLVKVGDGITVSMWCKIPSGNSIDFIPFNFRPLLTTSPSFGWKLAMAWSTNDDSFRVRGSGGISAYEYNVRDTWFNLVLTAEFGSDTSKQQIYIDGVSIANFSSALSSLPSNTDIYFYLGQYYRSTWDLTRGSWSNVNVYNRYLEPSEIKQNYNALKRRFL
jgi:hypothetical protein